MTEADDLQSMLGRLLDELERNGGRYDGVMLTNAEAKQVYARLQGWSTEHALCQLLMKERDDLQAKVQAERAAREQAEARVRELQSIVNDTGMATVCQNAGCQCYDHIDPDESEAHAGGPGHAGADGGERAEPQRDIAISRG